jgi:uncharacterized membrane protein
MNKSQFIRELNQHLKPLSERERSEIVADYEEHISVAKENGKTEEEAVASLGTPRTIAKEMLTICRIEKAETEKTVKNVTQAAFAAISMSLINLIFVLGPLVGVLSALFSFWVTGAALVLSSPLAIVQGVYNDVNLAFSILAAVACASFGVFVLAVMRYVTKWTFILLLKYIKLNVKIIKGGAK